MKFEVVDGKFTVERSAEEKAPLLSRLSRIEGQVRGLKQMIEDNRFYGDTMQQSSAIAAAVREVTLLMISQQFQAHMDVIGLNAEAKKGAAGIGVMEEFVELLRSAYRFQFQD